MPPLASSSASVPLRWARHQLPSASRAVIASSPAQQRRTKADGPIASFDGPYNWGGEKTPTTKIPSFKNYMSKKPETSNRVFGYVMAGTMGALSAAGAKATVQGKNTMGSLKESCGKWVKLANIGNLMQISWSICLHRRMCWLRLRSRLI